MKHENDRSIEGLRKQEFDILPGIDVIVIFHEAASAQGPSGRDSLFSPRSLIKSTAIQ